MGRDIARESYLCERRLGMRQVNAGQACLCNTSQGALPIRMEKTVFPVGNQMEQAFPLEMFRKKGNTFRGIPLFSFSPELPENHCTIYFITLVPCSLVKIRDFARENGVLLHVSVSNMRLDAFMGHSCSTSGERSLSLKH